MRRLILALIVGGSLLAATVAPALALDTPGTSTSAPNAALGAANSGAGSAGLTGDLSVRDGTPP